MMNRKKTIVIFIVLFTQAKSYCQQTTDTAALISEYNKVMAFTAQPYLYYTTITKLDASPVLQEQDTASMKGEFFKYNTNIYSNNVREEMYMQDSLLVNINHDRKTIWLNKVDVSTKEKMNVIPAGSKEIQQIMQRNYAISKSVIDAGTSRLLFETRRVPGTVSPTHTNISIEYNSKTYLPKSIVIEIMVKQAMDEEMLASLKEQEIDEKKLVQEIDGVKYMVRKQSMHIVFTEIHKEKESVPQMPLYSSCVEYSTGTGEFTGKGKYRDYEITKLF